MPAPPQSGAIGSTAAPAEAAPVATTRDGVRDTPAPTPTSERTAGTPPRREGDPSVVVLRASGAPAPRAEVFFRPDQAYARRKADDDALQPWDAAERFGQRARADADGGCALPGSATAWHVAAALEGEFGYAAMGPTDAQTLHMSLDEQVLLRARFGDGAPAAVPVALLQLASAQESRTLWRGDTDGDGRARVPHFQLLRQPQPTDGPPAPERFAALVRLPTTPLTLVEFPGRPAPQQPVALTVPDLGRVAVQLRCHSGRALLSPARVGFGAERRPREEGAFPVSRRLLHQSAEKPVGDATVTLPYAQVGRASRVYARYPHERRASYAAASAGPTRRGELAEVRIQPLPEHAVLAGRLLDEAGAPLAGAVAQLTVWRGDQVQATAQVETVADGSWDCVLRGHGEEAAWRVEFRREHIGPSLEFTGDPSTWFTGASVAIGPWPGGRRTELGDVRMTALPLLCAGQVIDGAGRPVAGARVTVEQEGAASSSGGARSFRSREGLNIVFGQGGRAQLSSNLGQPRARWRTLPGLQARTDDGGAFAIRAAFPPGKLRVRADTDRHFRDSAPLPAPADDLRIRLLENGIFTGEVKLPPWLPDRAVTVTLRPRDPARQGRDARSDRVAARDQGGVRIEPLRAGSYDLLVQLRGLRTPLATVEGVLVNPGENRDPRVAPLDLSEALHRFQLRARDEAGQPLDLDGPIHARLQALDGTWSEAGFRWQKGRAELITAHATAELTFFGRGFVPQRRQLLAGDHDVYLQTQRPALVMVPGARALSGEDRKVRISAILKGDTGYPASLSGTDQRTGRRFSFPRWDLGRSSGGWLGATDVVEIPLMKAGQYELIFRAHANETTRTPQTQVSLGTFELTPGGATTTTVPVPSEAVVEALRKLDEQWRAAQAARSKRGG
ncbi:MAG: hypothetical protein ACON4Z_14215 [Planctomycetota bacterium]